MWKRITVAVLAAAVVATSAAAQLEWDRKKTDVPVPNPSPVRASRDEIAAAIKALLDRNQIPIRSEGSGERGVLTVTTEPVVFARGIVARTQLGHFADLTGSARTEFTRGRVAMRIEIEPSTPTTSLVGVTGTFEGLRSATTEWTGYRSLGRLEDKFLKLLLANLAGQSFPDVQPDDPLLEAAGENR